jgi:L-type amino acid transporter 6
MFFLLAVLGIYRIRRDPTMKSAYRTPTANPFIFCLLSGFLVLRGIITDPLQGAAIALLILVGWLLFRYAFRRAVL